MYHFKALNKTLDSVTYFINIQKPLEKGDTTELLVNYKVRFKCLSLAATLLG